MKARICVAFAAMIVTAISAIADGSEVYRFDMGTAASEVAEGFARVTEEDDYSADRGYGWETKGVRSVSHEEGFPVYAVAKSEGRTLYRDFRKLADPLNVDSVIADGELALRVDVPQRDIPRQCFGGRHGPESRRHYLRPYAKSLFVFRHFSKVLTIEDIGSRLSSLRWKLSRNALDPVHYSQDYPCRPVFASRAAFHVRARQPELAG